MAYRLAKSLETLRSQVNARWPTRSKASDGWIGDTAHAARKSDHNPNAAGVVQAFDVTHDPSSGCDAYKLAEVLRLARDPRIKYVISNGRIFSSKVSPWTWRPYTGASKHDHHTHISVDDDPKLYDSTEPWIIDTTVKPTPDEPDWRTAAAKNIINWEAARDSAGHLKVHTPGDGSFEVAGISSNAHKELATKLRDLVNLGQHAEAERLVADFVLSYTAPVQKWTDDRGVEFFLRDSFYNRGPRGAANILQRAVGVEVDEDVGPKTLAAVDKMAPNELLTRLRKAREEYELEKYGRRAQYWTGLNNRWNNALAVARSLQTAPARDTQWIQNALNALGAKPPLVVDGILGTKTLQMLKIFQKENGLKETGTPTPETIAELEKHIAQPLKMTDKIEAPQEGFWAKFFKLIGG